MKVLSDEDKQGMITAALEIYKIDPNAPVVKELIGVVVRATILEIAMEEGLLNEVPLV